MGNSKIINEKLLLSNPKFMESYEIAHNEYISKGKSKMIKSGIDNNKIAILLNSNNTKESATIITIYNEVITEMFLTA